MSVEDWWDPGTRIQRKTLQLPTLCRMRAEGPTGPTPFTLLLSDALSLLCAPCSSLLQGFAGLPLLTASFPRAHLACSLPPSGSHMITHLPTQTLQALPCLHIPSLSRCFNVLHSTRHHLTYCLFVPSLKLRAKGVGIMFSSPMYLLST